MSSAATENPGALNTTLLLSTFLQLEPEADGFAQTFYRILFERYPNIQPLFAKTDMEKQRKKLIESLQLVMANVHSSETLDRILRNLGKKHVGYGAVLTDYPLIGDALLRALEHHLRGSWTLEAEQTWTAAYQLIASLMAEGAKSAALDSANLQAAESPAVDAAATKSFINQFDSSKLLIVFAIAGMTGVLGYTVWSMNQDSQPTAPTEQRQ